MKAASSQSFSIKFIMEKGHGLAIWFEIIA
jgi:hypothetical protein